MVRKVGGVVESFDELRNGDRVNFTHLFEHSVYNFEEGQSYPVGFDHCGYFGIIDRSGDAAEECGDTFHNSEIEFVKLAGEENKRVELTNKHYVHKDDIPDYETYLRVTKTFNDAGFPYCQNYGRYEDLKYHDALGVYEYDNTIILYKEYEITEDMFRVHPDELLMKDCEEESSQEDDKGVVEESEVDYKSLLMSVIFSAENYNGHNQAQIPKLSFEEINHLAKAIEEYLEDDPDARSIDCEIRLHTDGSGAIYVINWWKQGEHPLGHLDKLIVDWEG